MGTSLATGLSKAKESAAAAKEAVLAAKAKLEGGRVDLSMLYVSSEYDYGKAVDAVRKATNNAPLIGASSAGEFTEKRVEKGSVAVGLLSSDDIKVFTALAEGVKENPEAAMRRVAANLPREVEGYPHLTAIILVDGLSGAGEEVALLTSYLSGHKLKVVGGMAGDDFKMTKTFVFSNDKVRTNALSACLLASKMPLFTGVKHGHTPLSEELKASRTKGNVLYEINGRPAWEIWKKETAQVARKRGIDVEQLKTPAEIAQFLTNYMLGLATGKDGQYKTRWPESVNKDGSLNFTCGIAQGAIFRIMDSSNLENQINAAEKAARIARKSAENAGHSEFAGIIVFDCAHRQMLLGDRFSEAVDRFKRVLPDVPMLGLETYGEIRLEPGEFSGFHNSTSVVLLLPSSTG
ncbi:MAG: FIST C-terminal domain-containing protein [Deltaproteobacteria bacterium]|jgi:methyl-accepting chemotaxis protein|nr:FIST C-terminal domain-containing protein [Deltaproteobacteria bacterium]